jgi:soluble lytic murein transglycosylase-like protein
VKAAVLLAVLCLGASGARAACAAACTATRATALVEVEMCWADYYARTYGVPLEFVEAIIDVESAWQPDVVSAKGAAGLMQLMPATAAAFGVTNRFRIDENIRGGVAYLAYLMGRFEGELRLVAAAYYAGERAIQKYGLAYADADVYRYVAQVQRFCLYRRRQMVKGGEHP